jgi:peptidoglycan/xylan/chitin deacetylase (PgdA/CDA1 family)
VQLAPFVVRRLVKRTLESHAVASATLRAGARRGHGLTLLFHRVGPDGPRDHEVVRSVPTRVFLRQLELLADVGDVVPADELAAAPVGERRPRFALTFDDDYASQLTVAHLLAGLGLPGTFFLSGRALHGRGAYWWEVLEARIAADGVAATAADLGVTAADPLELAAACEARGLTGPLVEEGDATPADHLTAADIAELASLPGTTVGFHTVDHPLLPALGAAELDDALTRGRAELAAVVGAPVDLLAYPHGKADEAVARAAAAAGYRRAWTGRIEPTTADSSPHLLGRWEPGGLDARAFAAQLAIRLHRPDPGPSPS